LLWVVAVAVVLAQLARFVFAVELTRSARVKPVVGGDEGDGPAHGRWAAAVEIGLAAQSPRASASLQSSSPFQEATKIGREAPFQSAHALGREIAASR